MVILFKFYLDSTSAVEQPRFGCVEALFDDEKWYPGVIIGKNPDTNKYLTHFEDGSEDEVDNPTIHIIQTIA